MRKKIIRILRREGEWGAQFTLGEYVNMVEAEVDDIICPSSQVEFGFVEVGEFYSREKGGGRRL